MEIDNLLLQKIQSMLSNNTQDSKYLFLQLFIKFFKTKNIKKCIIGMH